MSDASVTFITAENLAACEWLTHGFPTRAGGVSTGPYAALNCSTSTGDSAAAVEENRRRLAHAAGIAVDRFLSVSQVHGDDILVFDFPERMIPQYATQQFDGMLTRRPGVALGIRTADCVPVLLADPATHSVGAAHAGWRGAARGIAGKAVRMMSKLFNAAPESILVALGPCIHRDAYEVSDDIAHGFADKFGAECVTVRDPTGEDILPRYFLDLPLAVRRSLQQDGVLAENIHDVNRCTFSEPAHFYSHRRDGEHTGRHLSFIAVAS